jgi:hypothetical protein
LTTFLGENNPCEIALLEIIKIPNKRTINEVFKDFAML